METKYTPGKWELEVEYDGTGEYLETVILRMGSCLKNQAYYKGQHCFDFSNSHFDGTMDPAQEEEALANVRLMATAPAMHEAAEEAMHVLLCIDSHMDDRVRAAKKIAGAIGYRWPPNTLEEAEEFSNA